jgi:hypothetical protein
MDALNKALEPITNLFPESVRDILNGGGWLAVLGVLALLILFILWKLFFSGGRKPKAAAEWEKQEINLAKCPMPAGSPRGRRLTLYHVPARLRLVVVAPVGRELKVTARDVDQVLDKVVAGLGGVILADRPSVHVWPAQLSYQGFANTFHRCTPKPEGEGRPSRWVLVAGRAKVGKQAVLIGLGAWADEAGTLGRKTLEPPDWVDVVRLERQKD